MTRPMELNRVRDRTQTELIPRRQTTASPSCPKPEDSKGAPAHTPPGGCELVFARWRTLPPAFAITSQEGQRLSRLAERLLRRPEWERQSPLLALELGMSAGPALRNAAGD